MNESLVNPHLLKVPLYIAGKSAEEVQEELGLRHVIKLSSNENPLGPSPKALDALQAGMSQAHRYPGVAERDLRRALARFHGQGLTPENFIIGNGGTDVLRMVAQTFVFDGAETIMSRVTFPLYALLTDMFGGKPIRIKPRTDWGLDLAAMAGSLNDNSRIIWLCSPNNPTGHALSRDGIEMLLEKLPEHVIAVLDESYSDFVTLPDPVDSIGLVQAGRPVVVVRSFSKFAGLANLRIGYGIANPQVIEFLLHTKLPFSTGGVAIQAAAASLNDGAYHQAARELVIEEREILHAEIMQLGLHCLPSQANFILVLNVPGGGREFSERLLRRGLIVRPMGPFGSPESIRVTIGRREENLLLLEALEELQTLTVNTEKDEAVP